MVVMIIDNEEVYAPTAIVDGTMPALASSLRTLDLLETVGLMSCSYAERGTRFGAFESVSTIVNDLEARYFLSERDGGLETRSRNLHQYLIYDKGALQGESAVRPTIGGTTILRRFDFVAAAEASPFYCVNVIVDPFGSESFRLKKYVLDWVATTKLEVASREDYIDADRYKSYCDDLLERIAALYDDPIGHSLRGLVNLDGDHLGGVRINP
jgi:hypothetical protein